MPVNCLVASCVVWIGVGAVAWGVKAADGPGGAGGAAHLPPAPAKVDRWGLFELALAGPQEGNPFLDVELSARFTQGERSFEPQGFYDGDGVYRVRFMPDALGEWRYVTRSNRKELDGRSGAFTCGAPASGNHGPVRVHNTYHLSYADAAPYFQVGTTCYAWVHQPEALQQKTLRTLAGSPFNKIRFCVFPKSYAYNANEPERFAFVRGPDGKFDFTRFDPAFWRHFEGRVADLSRLGIEADLILFHPYDRWGFATLSPQADDRYLRYAAARLAAHRNVWWSLANEYDLMAPGTKNHRGNKTMDDWDRFFQILQKYDPYGHLRGIHNCRAFYDHSKSWVTHASIQSSNLASVPELREKYHKPIVFDECKYEGNIPQGWGNLSAEEMVRRFWIGTVRGGYVGHGETYKHPEDILWWSKGGTLHGESPARIAFLKQVMTAIPFQEMMPQTGPAPGVYLLAKPGEHYLVYFTQPVAATVALAGDRPYKVEGLDTWAMTCASLGSAKGGAFSFTAPRADFLVHLSADTPDSHKSQPKEAAAPVSRPSKP
jgi:hypothetical protein